MKEIDISKARTPSSLWRYAGLDPRTASYNARLKSMLLGEVARALLKSPYASVYRKYSTRIKSRSDINRLHRHRMAVRYMVKCYLKDLHLSWRQKEGYSVPKPYDNCNSQKKL